MRLGIRAQESGGNYQAHNLKADGGRGAHGAYQFIWPTWHGYGFDAMFGATRADQATEMQQDKAAEIALRILYADPYCEKDFERVIAAWFAGPVGQAGPKANWDRAPDGTGSYNPEIGEYVAGVLGHIEEII